MYIPARPLDGVKKHGDVQSRTYQCQWNITDDGKGFLNGTLRIFINHRSGKAIEADFEMPQRGEKHPFDERLYCIGSTVSFGSNDIAYCDANYIGLRDDPAQITWTLNCPTEESDIQLHPNFLKKGKAGSGAFNIVKTEPTDTEPAVFDTAEVVTNQKTGEFERFAYTKANGPDGEKRLYGVKSFKDPRITMNVSYKTAKTEYFFWTIQYIGQWFPYVPLGPSWTKISQKDDKRSWLLIDSNITEEGGFYNVSVQFALSGAAGWNPLVYKQGTPSVASPPAGAGGAQWR